MQTRLSTILIALATGCAVPVEPEPELPTAHVRICYSPAASNVDGDCRGHGYWGNERAPTRNGAVPLPGIRVRICSFSDFHECHARSPGHFQLATTDDEGYAVFPDLVEAVYLFLPDVENVEVGPCVFVPRNEYGGALTIQPRVPTTPVEYQNSHIGEMWFLPESCGGNVPASGGQAK